MEQDSLHRIAVQFLADDDWWTEGRRALQAIVAETELSGNAVTLPNTPASPRVHGETAKGMMSDFLLGVTAGALAELLAQLVNYLVRLPHRPHSIELSATPVASDGPNAPLATPSLLSSNQPFTLEIDCRQVYDELRDLARNPVPNGIPATTETERTIEQWVLVTVTDAEPVLIRIRLQ